MRTYIGRHVAVTDTDYLELALGTPLDLWLGDEGESVEERAARLDAARDILADAPHLYDRVLQTAAETLEVLEARAPRLLAMPGTTQPTGTAVRDALRTAVAA
jgi:hypothetical protein